MNTRRLYWLAFLGGAGALAVVPELFFAEPEAEALAVRPAARPEARGTLAELRSPQAPAADGVKPATASGQPVPQADLFAAQSWYVAPPAPPAQAVQASAPPPPPRPSAPPLPFRFIGKLDDSQELQVFLQNGEKLYTVRVGDVIDSTYRVEGIQHARMTLTYLPLRISQSLAVGSEP
ncbi:hypothetical protein D9M69_373740 [compost metagenome]